MSGSSERAAALRETKERTNNMKTSMAIDLADVDFVRSDKDAAYHNWVAFKNGKLQCVSKVEADIIIDMLASGKRPVLVIRNGKK